MKPVKIVWLFVLLASGFLSIGGQSVTLAWNANSETNLAGYRLYWGPSTRNYTNRNVVLAPTTQNVVSNLAAGSTTFFAVTAYTDDGLESDYSDEVSYTVPSPEQKPVSPFNFRQDAALRSGPDTARRRGKSTKPSDRGALELESVTAFLPRREYRGGPSHRGTHRLQHARLQRVSGRR